MVIESLPRLVMFFLGIPSRPISFLAVYEALLASLSAGVCFRTGVAAGVTGGTCSVRVLLAVAAVCEVGV